MSYRLDISPANLKWVESAKCVISGEFAEIRPLRLKRMSIGAASQGIAVDLDCPLANDINLHFWQSLRMVRWVIAVASWGTLLAFIRIPIADEALAGKIAIGVSAVFAVIIYFILSKLVNRHEPIRIIGYDWDSGDCRIEFANERIFNTFKSQVKSGIIEDAKA